MGKLRPYLSLVTILSKDTAEKGYRPARGRFGVRMRRKPGRIDGIFMAATDRVRVNAFIAIDDLGSRRRVQTWPDRNERASPTPEPGLESAINFGRYSRKMALEVITAMRARAVEWGEPTLLRPLVRFDRGEKTDGRRAPIVEVPFLESALLPVMVSAPGFPLDAGSGSVYQCLNNWGSSVATFLR
jgi:hypothetical protein